MKNIKALCLSGGGTKFIGILAKAYVIVKDGYRPDLIAGISAGSLAMLAVAMHRWDKAIEIGLHIRLRDFFSFVPVHKDGSIRVWAYVWRKMILRRRSLGVQHLDGLIDRVIGEDLFEKYRHNDRYPPCWAVAVSPESGERRAWNLKDLSYEDAKKAIAASSAIPVYTQPVYFEGQHWFDGGLRNHNPSGWLLDTMGEDVAELHSVYSRPGNYRLPNVLWGKSLIRTWLRSTEIQNYELSKTDESDEVKWQKMDPEHRKLHQHFLPAILSGPYDTDPARLRNLYDRAYEED